jgi:tetratricopeptide (TPR) repeat protein
VNNLAELLRSKGDYAGAEPLMQRALEERERVLGPEHPNTLASVNNLAELLRSEGDYAGAEPLFRRALEANERVLGPEHPDTLLSVNNLATLLSSKSDYAGAEPLFRRALEASERVLGPEHPSTLTSVNGLAESLRSEGDYAGAEPLFRRALEANERVLGPEHPNTLLSVNNLAVLLYDKGDYAGAARLFRRALEASERVLGPEHPDTITSAQNLADLMEKTGHPDEARSLRARRLAVLENKGEATSVDLRAAALDAFRLANYSRATRLLQRVLDAGFEIPGTCIHLARIALLVGDDVGARDHVVKAWEHRGEAPPYVVPRILWLQLVLLYTRPGEEPGADTAAIILGRLKTALAHEGAHMEWTMAPVLAHLQPRLPAEQHALLAALVAALSDANHLPALEQFPAWRDAASEPLG